MSEDQAPYGKHKPGAIEYPSQVIPVARDEFGANIEVGIVLGIIIVNFSKTPVSFLGFDAESARKLAGSLTKYADELDARSAKVGA